MCYLVNMDSKYQSMNAGISAFVGPFPNYQFKYSVVSYLASRASYPLFPKIVVSEFEGRAPKLRSKKFVVG